MLSRPKWTQNNNPRADVLYWMILACSHPEPATPKPESATVPIASVDIPNPVGPGTPKSTSVPIKQTSGIQFAITTLSQLLHDHARDPNNPWAVGHALLATGPTLMLNNQSDAVQWLFSEYGERFEVDSQWLVRFPTSRGSIRVEPHADLLLKAMTDVGVDPELEVTVQGVRHKVGDLYRGSLADQWFDQSTNSFSFGSPNDIPWSLFGIASWSEPNATWTGTKGTSTSLNALTDFTVEILGRETDFLATAKSEKTGFQKRGQGIFQYTCGGAHLLQGVAHATLRGFGSQTNRARIKHQLHLLLYRFPIELRQIDAGADQHPQYKLPLRIQRLKLTGHTLETLYRLSPTDLIGEQDRTALEQVAAEVVKSVVMLKETAAFTNMEQIRSQNEQMYLDIIGDAAHALRGLRIATGESPVYY